MRTIKFRAWLKDSALEGLNKSHFTRNGRLYEVEWMNFEGGLVSVRTPSELEFKLNDVDLMQFTGLLDKHGNEIYEGDILQRSPKGSFEYSPFEFIWNVTELSQDGEYEVIGNKFENPELLGGVS